MLSYEDAATWNWMGLIFVKNMHILFTFHNNKLHWVCKAA